MSLHMTVTVQEDGLAQFLMGLSGVAKNLESASYAGLMRGAQKMVDVTRANITSMFRSKTHNLYNSIQIIDSISSGGTSSVTIGSTIPGYPFFQEFGFTARLPSGKTREVPPKFYMMSAMIQVAPEMPEFIEVEFNMLQGGGGGYT